MRTTILLTLVSLLLLGGCHGRLTRPDEPAPQRPEDCVDRAREAEIEAYPWPDYVTGEERNRIEEALRTIFDLGGRDGQEAEAFLIALDKDADATSLRAAGRIVSEMKTVVDKHGVDGYEGKSRIMVLDRMLRRIDGVQERLFKEEYGLDIDESAKRALRLVRTWNWWYREGRFLTRYAPWDWRVDGQDDEEDEDDSNPVD